MKQRLEVLILGLLLIHGVGCTRKDSALVTGVTTQPAGMHPAISQDGPLNGKDATLPSPPVTSAAPSSPSTGSPAHPANSPTPATTQPAAPALGTVQAIQATVTFGREILAQNFFYGADLQYSSIFDKGLDLFIQSQALGHIPARFQIVGDELELIADSRAQFPSDVNHPDELITRFKIVNQTATEITVQAEKAGNYLAKLIEAATEKKAENVQDSWLRSFDFDSNGNYILQQTSIQLADGSVAEFMESIFPQKILAPGKDFQPIQMNPKDPTGKISPDDALRSSFMLLPSDPIFEADKNGIPAQEPISYASHVDFSNQAIMAWYVTPNAPDAVLPYLKLAVEGWNRYFRTFKGMSRDVVAFKGRLPDGIHLGDPRYNVINWDSRLVAGAAYESQATDLATGKQSHSLIYMPAAWLQIGTDYWKSGRYTVPSAPTPGTPAPTTAFARAARLKCLRDVTDGPSAIAAGRVSKAEVMDFAIGLLKDTLFHEVGHALGLAHNFKGSLSYDRSKPGSAFSTSIMDYNNYEIEIAAFENKDSANGPLLEYDRRALSAIYNQGNDITQEQFMNPLPACNDAISDNLKGGVDPLCIRYDIENDPTLSITTAMNRISNAKVEGDVTLADAITRISGDVLSEEAAKAADTGEKFLSLVNDAVSAIRGTIRFYYMQDKSSLGYATRVNLRSLLVFAPDAELPAEFSATKMRERAFQGATAAVTSYELPTTVSDAIKGVTKTLQDQVVKTPFFAKVPADQQQKMLTQLMTDTQAKIDEVKNDETEGLPKMRAAVIAGLARKPDVEFFLGDNEGKAVDYETEVVTLLAKVATDPVQPTVSERTAAAKALLTFKGRRGAREILTSVLTKVKAERIAATTNEKREPAEAVYAVLTAKTPAPTQDDGE